jgi:Novel STAND NTPase 1
MPIAEHFAAECPSTEATRTFTLNAHWPEYPYPGLRPFRVTSSSDESLIFYGRNAQKDDILDRLNKAHTVFVLAPSGCGKPSLIKAGVIPTLEVLGGRLAHSRRASLAVRGNAPGQSTAGIIEQSIRFNSPGTKCTRFG